MNPPSPIFLFLHDVDEDVLGLAAFLCLVFIPKFFRLGKRDCYVPTLTSVVVREPFVEAQMDYLPIGLWHDVPCNTSRPARSSVLPSLEPHHSPRNVSSLTMTTWSVRRMCSFPASWPLRAMNLIHCTPCSSRKTSAAAAYNAESMALKYTMTG